MSSKAKVLMAGGAVVLLLVLAIGFYLQAETEREEQERLEQLQALERAKAEAQKLMPGFQQAPEYPPPERKWEKEPRPLEFITACQNALKKLPMAHAGWNLLNVRCEGSSLTQNWVRAGGYSSPPPGSTVNDMGTMASVSLPLEALTPRGGESLLDPAEITRRYLGQNWSGTLTRLPDDPPPPPPPGYDGPWNPPPAPWVKRSVMLTAPALPWLLPTIFQDIPGAVITSLVSNLSGSRGSWAIDGVIYENRR
jgi:hypothetical protein